MGISVGMYGGSFDPLHMGHVQCICKASCMVDELYVVLSYSKNRDTIYYKERYKWLYSLIKKIENVRLIAVEDNFSNKDTYDWNSGANEIKSIIGKKINFTFWGSDYKEKQDFLKKLYPDSEIVFFDREDNNISSSAIRSEGVFKHWDKIPNEIKAYFNKKVLIVGTESCGKSTLVKNLALYYNTNYIEEYGRDVCEEVGGALNMQEEDFPKIAYGHKMKEYEAIKKSNKILFIDTDVIVTNFYLKLYVNDKNNDLLYSNINNHNAYDLVIYLEPTTKWVNDGTRYHGETLIRENNNKKLKALLEENNINFISIKEEGYLARFNEAIKLVDRLF